MVKQIKHNDDEEQNPNQEHDEWGWLKDIKHRMECSQCEYAYYVHSECAWYCQRQRKLTEGYCEYYWITFNQCRQSGGYVNRGEHGKQIICI